VYRSGKSENLAVLVPGSSGPMIPELRDYVNPRFSPDGKQVAITVTGPQGNDIWVFDRAKTTLTRVTSEGANARAEWTPDGKKLLFISDRGGKPAYWLQAADGSGTAERLHEPAEGDPFEGIISPDNKWLVYRTGPGGKPARSILAVDLAAKGKSVPIVVTQHYTQMPRLSPNGKWLAYQSNESGDFEVYVRPFPGSGGRVQVSSGGGLEPLWSRAGDALFHRQRQDVIRSTVTTGESFSIGERKTVLTGDFLTNPSHPNYDVTPDGKQFLMIRRAGAEVQTIVVHNFRRELKARTAGAP
jgi:Tol biopolymer transport system component